jgi:hypothetical protein
MRDSTFNDEEGIRPASVVDRVHSMALYRFSPGQNGNIPADAVISPTMTKAMPARPLAITRDLALLLAGDLLTTLRLVKVVVTGITIAPLELTSVSE